MLYDNPQLALTYLDAFRVTLARQRSSGSSGSSTLAATAAADAGAALASPIAAGSSSGVSTADEVLYDPRVYATVVRGVLDYLRRDMTHPEGGLYSAEVGVLRARSTDAAQFVVLCVRRQRRGCHTCLFQNFVLQYCRLRYSSPGIAVCGSLCCIRSLPV
jgi:hypothetical protein